MSWKLALYDFIHARNRTGVDYDWRPLRAGVADEAFLSRFSALQERRKAKHRERGLTTDRSETRLAVRSAESAEGKITVEIKLHKQLFFRVKGIPIKEETVEAERLALRQLPGGKWIITAVTESALSVGDVRAAPITPPIHMTASLTPWATDAAAPGNVFTTAAAYGSKPSVPFIIPDPIAPSLERKSESKYNRELARQYAERWWNAYNPRYIHFDVDCSNYVSQCMAAGGIPMDFSGRRQAGWWYRGRNGSQELWSFSWAVAHALQVYLGGNRKGGVQVEPVGSPKELSVGDVISYCWDGDGRYGHSTVVTGFDPEGMPLVNAHTVNSRNRYWDYADSYAWTERTKYRFFHIQD